MANQEEPIRIVIEEEDLPLIPDKPGRSAPDVKAGAKQVGDKAAELAQKAWDSEPRRKVTDGAAALAAKGSKAVANKMADTMEQQARQQATALQHRVQETDWKEEAKKGSAQGLRWLSEKLSALADRVTTGSSSAPADGTEGKE
ncbi:MAG: hypothetical protein KA362_09130 [Chloroflexi bacterium]|nr:hypothetical protein [Chloroflexota bacterium]MBK7180519.1 hypothetical protein [Chloroflexota bacterium]MBK8934609.1 hypothetical protein [Chloroflexota bacterium]MBP6804261.1 hypothetical protein [Chloroflexota bacterium]MBP7590795.1 hypothetical protein [Chloroflexota bacterium]